MTAATASNPILAGYPDRISYRAGEEVPVCCSALTGEFDVTIVRDGLTPATVWSRRGIEARPLPVPADVVSSGCRWPASFTVPTADDWPSGYHEVRLQATVDGHDREALAYFVVRPGRAARRAPMLLVLATNTYNAYNDWGGGSLYTGDVKVSFRRPMADGFLRKPEPAMRKANVVKAYDPQATGYQQWALAHGLSEWSGSSGWWNWERPFVRWAQAQGYELDVATDTDLHADPALLDGYRLVLFVGHSEYWSWAMRDHVEEFIAAGGNVMFLTGNTAWWQVRFEDCDAAMVCYKRQSDDDPVNDTVNQHLLTSPFSNLPVGRPESFMTGVSSAFGGYGRYGPGVPRGSGGFTVWRPEHWAFEGTGLKYGDVVGAVPVIASYECDGCEITLDDTGRPAPTGANGTPTNMAILATAPARLWSDEEYPDRYAEHPAEKGLSSMEYVANCLFGNHEPEALRRISYNHAVMGIFTRGGTVFTSGCTDWAYALAAGDHDVSAITRNLIDRLSA
jgi:N,N-dimethylformamidase beta subunit-like, C-terminal